tara:strand:- start:80 stop:580 length:501 start_codon:yes stop_codon:yes gene_type:complete
MAITRLPATALSGTSLPSTITTASGLPLGKLINSSRAFITSGTVSLNTSSVTDTGFDHTYTASSTSHKLLHMINCAWRKNTEGGVSGQATIYADDSSISEISSSAALGEWHQDSATTDIKGSTIHYFSSSVASTSAIKYSIYAKGENFLLQAGSGNPLIWTIFEIS